MSDASLLEVSIYSSVSRGVFVLSSALNRTNYIESIKEALAFLGNLRSFSSCGEAYGIIPDFFDILANASKHLRVLQLP